MRTIHVSLAALAALLFPPAWTAPQATAQQPAGAPGGHRWTPTPAFVPNLGQWEHRADFVSRVGATTIHLDEAGWSVGLHDPDGGGATLRMTLVDAATTGLRGEQPLPGVHHYLRGPDPDRWRRDVPRYAAVRYVDVAPGVDVRLRESQGHFEYDLLLAPRADLDAVQIEVSGAAGLHIEDDGTLRIDTGVGPVRMPLPVSWEVGGDGTRHPIDCRYRLLDADRFGFAAEDRDTQRPLVVDPGIVWSTFLGGTADEGMLEVEVDPTGAVTVAGWTRSDDLPTNSNSWQAVRGGAGGGFGTEDTFVARFSSDATTLLWCTYLGGSREDWVRDMHFDRSSGNCTLVGYTTSSDFPTTAGAYQPASNGGWEAFVTRLDLTGFPLFSTYVGSAGSERASGVDVGPNGAITVSGRTNSAAFPFTGGTFVGGGGGDAMCFQLDGTGSTLLWAIPLGGSDRDWAGDVAVDPATGVVGVTGGTWSRDFPTTAGAWQPSFAGGRSDRYVAILAAGDGRVLRATLLGGSGEDGVAGGELAWGANGGLVVGGITDSTDFPVTTGALDTTANGGVDAFVATFDPSLSTLRWATYLGGRGSDMLQTMHVDAQGLITVGGNFKSNDYPITAGAYRDGRHEVGVSQILPDGSALVHSTSFGLGTAMALLDLDVHAPGQVTFVGAGDVLTTAGVYQPVSNGNNEAYVARLDLTPYGPPRVTSITPNPVMNRPGEMVTVTGSNLQIVTSVSVAGIQSPPQRLQVLSDNSLLFAMPAGVTIGPNQPVVITSSSGSANTTLDVTGLHPPVLEAAGFGRRGIPVPYTIRGERGWTAALFVSLVQGPTVIPGVVALGIGGNMPTQLVLASVVVLDSSGTAQLTVTYPATLPPTTVHAQVIHFDASAPTLPLEVSNAAATRLF